MSSRGNHRVSFLGLGAMGAPMAGHLAKAGHQVVVYNRTGARADSWLAHYSAPSTQTPRAEPTPGQAVEGAELVFMCLGNDEDVRSVCHGENGVFSRLKEGAVLVDHTTTSADLAQELSEACAQKGADFLDAPVSGGQAGAENGALSVMVGGEIEVYERLEPIFAAYARKVAHMGPVGHGQKTKMVNQIAIAGLLQALSEALSFAQKMDLDTEKVIDVISKGAAQSWQMENRSHTMLKGEFDFGFSLDWMRKDLGICLAQAESCKASLPITAIIDQFYKQLQHKGDGRLDTSALIKLL